ncbi:surface antigen [Plasmodium falciparum UGT5.1]|uniref:Surface antigen n=1 Tax=Plasmodium falciparum UGT5.1 TaxID=1237627 RepID=W7JEF1_PLAFA|nr:surface antigen [Plasmodium falciparum UGT5.1]
MKRVMQQFHDRTTQRFQEYDEKLQEKRQICKDKCDKEIQKIILKDKLEKELMDKFATLHTDMQSDAIPTCVCEKSIADKVEKGCLRCGYGLGTVAPTVGIIGPIAVNAWKNTALKAAIAAAEKTGAAQGAAKGLAEGMRVTIGVLEQRGVGLLCPKLLKSIGDTIHYTDAEEIAKIILENLKRYCGLGNSLGDARCMGIRIKLGMILSGNRQTPPDNIYIRQMMEGIVHKAKLTATHVTKTTTKEVTKAAIETSTGAIDAASTHLYTTIAYSILAILIIVLIMVIIYLILRYRRKKKMKKKLQYIKLLEE